MSQNLTKVATIVDIARLKEEGLSKRAVAKRLGISRDTVSKYWNTANLELGQPCYSSRAQLVDPYKDYITERLENYPELSAKRLYKEIKKKGYEGSERIVRRHVQGIRPVKHREYKPFETLPGEQAQVDWGHFGNIAIEEKLFKLYAFVFTLCWSRVEAKEYLAGLNRSRVGNLREQMEKIVGLQDLYSTSAMAQAMQRALEYQAFGYGILKRILKGLDTGGLPEAPAPVSLPRYVRSLLRNDLIILDEVGYLILDKTASDHLFQLVSKTYEHVSMIITSNLDFSDWGTLFASPGTAAAVLDRLLHHAHVIALRGESYRIRNRLVPPQKNPAVGCQGKKKAT